MAVTLTALFFPALAGSAAAAEAGRWVEIGRSGGSIGSASVYSPTRKQVIGWGGFKSGNELRALDLDSRKWTRDYAPDKAKMGGNFYGGQEYAGWVGGTDRPGPFLLFRQACWDSERDRMVIVAENLTAAYDPGAKRWTDLKAAFEGPEGRREGRAPEGWRQPWFAPVPGQWGSCAYDAVNDEILLFPLWVTRTRGSRMKEPFEPGRPDDAGVRAGHYGTLVFDCRTNAWSRPELGGKGILAARRRLAALINEQREAARLGWKALIALRQERKDEAATLMAPAAEAQRAHNERLAAMTSMFQRLAQALTGYEAEQVREALKNLASVTERARRAAKGLSRGNVEELPALSSRQRAAYRELRLIRKHDLYLQPPPRCGTSVVYDSKNKVVVMAGGNHLDRLLKDTWVYECRTRRWRRRASAPEAANWPGMCFDSRRGLVLYSTEKATYAYDAGKDRWSRLGAGRPKGVYCDMAYDASRDLYVLNVSRNKYGADETTYLMKPPGTGAPVRTEPAPREEVDDAPFPPPPDPAVLARIRNMPSNTWLRARPDREPTHRSWSTMSWDPALRCVIYQGGGHAGTMDNTFSAYFPESNKWVNAFKSHYPPRVFGNWCSAGGFPAFERGVTLSMHCRWYESYAGLTVYGSHAGFEWATRERPLVPDGNVIASSPKIGPGPRCLHPTKPLLVGTAKGRYASAPVVASAVYLTDLSTGEEKAYRLPKPVPNVNREWSAMCVHPDRNVLVLHGMGDKKKGTDTETWILDLESPTSWKKLELVSTTPPVGMAKLNAIPGTDYVVSALPGSNDLWVLSLDRQEWKPLPVSDGDDKLGKRRRFDLYGQCVYDPHHKVFIMVGLRGGYETRYTLLLKPDFGKIQWGEK